ncbi:hypothetical protein AVEN_96475-1 [Araneus ventricosus]|uniref:Uncharacterized protein n=1 Tax=Araneus ventricosus TaxID=182803 RepID=A0A4Y2CTQ8_ARAVE|nr:hypothetical protein AVEN_96475-1 [Araneus ventricosus]
MTTRRGWFSQTSPTTLTASPSSSARLSTSSCNSSSNTHSTINNNHSNSMMTGQAAMAAQILSLTPSDAKPLRHSKGLRRSRTDSTESLTGIGM